MAENQEQPLPPPDQGAARPYRLCPTLPETQGPPGPAWPQLSTFWSGPGSDSGPVGVYRAEPVSVQGKKGGKGRTYHLLIYYYVSDRQRDPVRKTPSDGLKTSCRLHSTGVRMGAPTQGDS